MSENTHSALLWTGSCISFHLICSGSKCDLAQQFCWSGSFCFSSLQLHQQIHHIVFSTTHPTQTFFIWSREAKMFCCINDSLFIVKSRSAHWHTVQFSLSLYEFPVVSETHLKIKDIHIQDLLRARNIYLMCPSAKIKMKQEQSIHLNANILL